MLLDKHIDKLARVVTIFCKMSSEAPVVISANVYEFLPVIRKIWLGKGCLLAKSKYVMGEAKQRAKHQGHTDG